MNQGIVIGSGQIATVFKEVELQDVLIFASGVSNSNCIDPLNFKRERDLLKKTVIANQSKKIVYFSSCALSVGDYNLNPYYEHKKSMESLLKSLSSNYYIFRIPQLFGKPKHHNTLINFLYFSILEERPFKLFNNTYRYVIEINDVRLLVLEYILNSTSCSTIDLANPYRYSINDIVETIESLLNKKARYELVEKNDGYILNLSDLERFVIDRNIDVNFARNYLYNKLEYFINA